MRKIVFLVLMIAFSFGISACTYQTDPLDNPQPEFFTLFYTGDGYTIYKRIDIDEEKMYALIGFLVESEKGTTCTMGLYHLENYIVFYNDEYYDLQAGAQMKLYQGNDLVNMGIDISCRDN